MKILGGGTDHVHWYVKDLDKAMELLSKVLGSDFQVPFVLKDWKSRQSMNRVGLELIEPWTPDPELTNEMKENVTDRILALSFRVESLDEAVAELESYGLRVKRRFEMPGVCRDAIFDPSDTFGVAIELTELGPLWDATFEEAFGRDEERVL